MNNKREYGDFVQDIIDAIAAIQDFVGEMDFETFNNDRKTVYAVTRSIEIIGEAAKNIPVSVKEKYSDVPWKDMAAMRDKMIHGYFGVDQQVVWQTIKEDIPSIKPLFDKIIKDLH